MKTPAAILFLAGILVADTSVAQSVYKCTNPDGSVSYQDRACSGDAEEKTVRVRKPASKQSTAEPDIKLVSVPGIGAVAVAVFDYMETIVRDDGSDGVTMGLRSLPGAREKISIMLTFMKNQRGVVPDNQARAEAVRRSAQQYMGMHTRRTELLEFQSTAGVGLLTIVGDPRYPNNVAPPGEYATATVGHIYSPSMATAITVYSDGVENQGFKDALAILQSLVAEAEVRTALQAADTADLPAAPVGYDWQQLPAIKAALLRPSGWHFDTKTSDGDLAYFVSREPNTPPDGFDTGLTVNVITNVPSKTGMSAEEYAVTFISSGAGEFDTVGEPFSSRRGPFVSHGALFRAADADKGDFNAHMVAIANNKTGTVYLCIFEGPVAEWPEIWQQGETILSKMVIDDTI